MSSKFAIAGVIASGKTTVACMLSNDFQIPIGSFGAILKQYCIEQKTEPSRINLQNLGQNLIKKYGKKEFMHWIIQHSTLIDWKKELIMDGFRHVEVYDEFKTLFPKTRLIFCDCPLDTQIFRICQRDKILPNKAREIITHSTEKETKSLKDRADFIVTPDTEYKLLHKWVINEMKVSLNPVQKQKYVNKFITALQEYSFLKLPVFTNKQPSWYAFVFQCNPNEANGVSIEEFYNALHFIGLKEVDRPGSTAPIHNLPLFTEPNEVLPRLYQKKNFSYLNDYPNAVSFYQNAIKLPVWSFKDEEKIVDTYIKGIKYVCDLIVHQPNLLKKELAC